MKKSTFVIIALALLSLFSACNTGTQSGDKINAADRKAIADMAQHMFTALKHQDARYFKSISSDAYLKAAPFGYFDSLVNKVKPDTTATTIQVVSEYLVRHAYNSHADSIITDNKDGKDYKFVFPHLTDETYVYMFSVPGEDIGIAWLATTTFLKQKNEWRIQSFSMRPYQYLNKTSPELFTKAKDSYKAGNLMASEFYLLLASETLTAGGSYFHYLAEPEMKKFADSLKKGLIKNFPLPMKVSTLISQPTILGISAKLRHSGIYPLVVYKTSNNISDRETLGMENLQLHHIIDSLLTGITRSTDSMIYYALDDAPTPKTQPNKVEFVRGTKE
ncbi:MAG: hypothetical protein WCG87_02940 [Bacteroidota bacterium]